MTKAVVDTIEVGLAADPWVIGSPLVAAADAEAAAEVIK